MLKPIAFIGLLIASVSSVSSFAGYSYECGKYPVFNNQGQVIGEQPQYCYQTEPVKVGDYGMGYVAMTDDNRTYGYSMDRMRLFGNSSAKNDAIKLCQQYSKGKPCKIVARVKEDSSESCFALATKDKYSPYTLATGRTEQETASKALNLCQSQQGSTCQLESNQVFCPAGYWHWENR